jgi:tRNA-dihydrouridine synthase
MSKVKKIYLAPMEGITGYIYRNTYCKYFKGVDKYFMPFIAPAKGRPFRSRELRDVKPENNKNINVVPQLLTNSPEGFSKAAVCLKDMGYEEVNLNLGCPSKTVVTKYKGSGLLYDIDRLDNFLYEVYSTDIMKVSIKTRIGRDLPSEFEDILSVYNKYPISELIIHPRVQADFYMNTPNMSEFERAVSDYKSPETLCYNGDVANTQDFFKICHEYPGINAVMVGRGIIANPFLPEEIKGCENNAGLDRKSRFFDFVNELYELYCASDVGPGNTLFKMKELWTYMGGLFEETPDSKRALKKIMKSKRAEEYTEAVANLEASV